jgi:hypothetical protein
MESEAPCFRAARRQRKYTLHLFPHHLASSLHNLLTRETKERFLEHQVRFPVSVVLREMA